MLSSGLATIKVRSGRTRESCSKNGYPHIETEPSKQCKSSPELVEYHNFL